MPGDQLDLTPAADDVEDAGIIEQKRVSARKRRPKFEPTLAQREGVRLMKADRWSDDRIARRLGIARNTLLRSFRDELQYGADEVREQALRDLARASRKGKVAASNSLLRLSGLVPPGPQAPEKSDKPQKEEPATAEDKLGKKERATRDAQTAAIGTSWAELTTPRH